MSTKSEYAISTQDHLLVAYFIKTDKHFNFFHIYIQSWLKLRLTI